MSPSNNEIQRKNLTSGTKISVLAGSLYVLIFVLVAGTWLVNAADSEGITKGPNDHIEAEYRLIWQQINDFPVNDFAIDPLDNHNIYAAIDYPAAVAFSHDYGKTWMTRTLGAQTSADGEVIAIDPVSPNYIYVGVTPDHIYRSSDSGNSWTRIDGGITNGSRLSALYVHPVTPTLIFAGRWAATATIYRSTNRGNSWTAIPLVTGPSNDVVSQIFSDLTIPNRIYAVADNKVYISQDSGLTWSEETYLAVALAVAHDDPSLMYRLHLDCYPYRSTNGGLTWIRLNKAEQACYEGIYLDPIDSDIVYLTSQYRAVGRSLDGGQTWQVLDGQYSSGPDVWALAIDPYDPTRLYVGQWANVSILFDNSVYLPAIP